MGVIWTYEGCLSQTAADQWGKEEILWFQYMEQQHLTLPNAVICGMAKEGIEPANISGVPLSPTVIYNYLKRQATGCKGKRCMQELLGT